MLRAKLFSLWVAAICCGPAYSQSTWNASFSDSTSLFPWVGSSHFHVEDGQLRLLAPGAGSAEIKHPSTAALSGQWFARLTLDFNPSSSNFAYLLLAGNGQTGVGWRVGGTAGDELAFGERTPTGFVAWWSSSSGYLNVEPIQLELSAVRDTLGWHLVHALNGSPANVAGPLQDLSAEPSSFLSWTCVFTATRSDKFYLDSVQVDGQPWQDNRGPRLQRLHQQGNQVLMRFDEPVDDAGAWQVTGMGPPAVISQPEPDSLVLEWNNWPGHGVERLLGTGLLDAAGNAAEVDTALRWFVAQWGDVRFSEVMAQPASGWLPQAEYIELQIGVPPPVWLNNWTLQMGSKTYTLPPTLASSEYLVLADLAWEGADELGNPVGLSWGNAAVPNGGALFQLFNERGELVDWINTAEFHPQENKEQGWSMELCAPGNCFDPLHWASNSSIGGTPGGTNEADCTPASQKQWATAGWLSPTLLNIRLNTGLYLDSLVFPGWEDAEVEQPDPMQLLFAFKAPWQAGERRAWVVEPSYFCRTPAPSDTLWVGVPVWPEKGAVQLNEVLMDPMPGGVTYVEVKNTGEQFVDLSKLRLSVRRGELVEGLWGPLAWPRMLAPGELVCFTAKEEVLPNFHRVLAPRQICPAQEMPGTFEDGRLVLLRADWEPLDAVDFGPAAYRGEEEAEGKALERYGDTDRWFVAGAASGFGTPGYANSRTRGEASGGFELASLPWRVFSPNGDGYRDVLEIVVRPKQDGKGRLVVVDERGNEVFAADVQGVGGQEVLAVWDGFTANGPCGAGPYAVWVTYKGNDGKEERQALACALAN